MPTHSLHPHPSSSSFLSNPKPHYYQTSNSITLIHAHHRPQPQDQELFSPPTKPITKKPPTIRSRVGDLCKSGELELARRLFDSAPPPLPTVIWNTLLIGYVLNSQPLPALRLFSLMNHSSPLVALDHYSYSSSLKACAHARLLTAGKSIHCHLLRHSPSPPKNTILFNSLLSMYCSSSSSEKLVRSLFDKMPKRNAVSWNTIIAWYVANLRPADALSQFLQMLEAGIRPTTVTFVNLFPAVTEMRIRNLANSLFGMLVKHGSEFANDVFVVSAAIFMYSEFSDIFSARQIFDLAGERNMNIEVWNTMIGGYVANERYEDAVELFMEVLESKEVSADSVTLLNSLMAVSQLQDVELGQQIHACLVKGTLESLSLILCNALVVMYSRCGCVQLAFDLFQQMEERDNVTWNTMISAFVQKGLNFEGLLLVYEMHKQGFTVDDVTASALLSAASNLGSLGIGRETHGYLIRHELECRGMKSYLIDMYSKSLCVEVAERIFDVTRDEDRDQVTWNAMIAGYMQNGRIEEALNLFRRMISEKNQVLNSMTVSSILPACDPVGGIQAGKEIHGFAIRQYLDKNVFVGTALVDMYSRCGEIDSAERVFDEMPERNTVTYTTMISGFGEHGLGEKSLFLFHAMQSSGVKPDAITFVAVLSACSYSGLVDEGLHLYESMNEYGILAGPEHCCCIVDLLGRAGRVEEAYEFVQSLGDENNAIEVWGSLLAACRVHQKFELAKLVSERLFAMEKGSDSAGYHVLLSNVYAEEGKWEKVKRVRKEMREKGLRKETGLSWIDVGDASHKFMSGGVKHAENDQIYAVLEELGAEMRLLGYKPRDTSFIHVSDQTND